jgi:RES domain
VSQGLASVQADRPLYRVGRRPNTWAWPDWAYAGPDGTFDNRWDDPSGSFRVLYACSQRVGAFVETLARFRPDLALVAALAEIDGPDDGPPAGVVPWTWLTNRASGEAIVSGRFADIGNANSLATLRTALAKNAIRHRLDEIDGATIRLKAPRAFTQEVSRFVHDWTDSDGRFTGIRYLSRLGNEFVNWAMFEPPHGEPSPLESTTTGAIAPDDADLSEALRILGLRLAEPEARTEVAAFSHPSVCEGDGKTPYRRGGDRLNDQ